ncbi:hypothetical protein BU25DRAFT_242313 [Macroventuria anomochaeta]|uniref:Uncharacterized protein n=1 Tax=Macroventuria anomochaeta TaxID=301207 RepID=A0ACB6S928_9PLEO|nr:uncharacterized protein BU25DRAFT_242313 [Macroventuria anomochaeta]KAF2630559.1 hypothetical protein BU25DRAFT_242313 [Macroventuria anomochaeta]
MLEPRRPITPVQVLDRYLVRRSNFTASDDPNEKGREGLVGADGRSGGQPGEVLKGINRTKSSTGQEQPRPTFAVPSALQSSPSLRITYTISVRTTPSATSIPEGGARVEIESLPGQNQNKPNLDDARIEAPALPGVNQDTSNMGEVLKPGSPAAAGAPERPSNAPAITVNKPLPGQNQANPVMGEAPLPVPPLPALALPPAPPIPPPSPLVTSSASAPSSSNEPSVYSVQTATTSTSLSTSAASTLTPLASSSSSFTLSSVTSFVKLTRSEQGKEEAPVTLALSNTTTLSATSTSVIPADNATPQAIAVAQSFSGALSSMTAIAAATLTPTAIPNNQDGSILHPTARTLLILFVILGALSILVAIVIFMMIRSHKNRSRAQRQAAMNQNLYDAPNDRIGVTTHISADPNDNPFLTASEKAIIDRAASPDGAADANNSSSFSDAISSFIKKSRSVAYKISP